VSAKNKIVPMSLKDAPAIIERALPVQKLSVESYKEQMAVHGKTLTALGSYWKGRKPLILNKACILGCLVPATNDIAKDLEIFELLMGMDDASMRIRLKLKIDEPLPARSYREHVVAAKRPEEIGDAVHSHIWDRVNDHLKTDAHSFPQLVEQLGIMRYGHRPRLADTFSGSGQIPFEAARLGCDVYAADLNPIACMLTWGAFNIVGGSNEQRTKLAAEQKALVAHVAKEIDRLGVEVDGKGWRAKVFLYCVETKCPNTGWMVPLLPSRVISTSKSAIVELVADRKNKRYDIVVRSGVTDAQLEAATSGTVRTEGRGQDPYMIHTVDGVEHRVKISTIRGDFTRPDGSTGNRLRQWAKTDFVPRVDDIFGERLYAIQWMKDDGSSRPDTAFRSVTDADLEREVVVQRYVADHIVEWQEKGWCPDMRIESGAKTDEPIRTRGWTHWHHLFNARQLMIAVNWNGRRTAAAAFPLAQLLNWNSRLCIWSIHDGGGGAVKNTFMNQALNTLFNFGCRGLVYCRSVLDLDPKTFPIERTISCKVESLAAQNAHQTADIFVTDPPYGDAVHYEEILEFFIAWLRKNPPAEFADWVWDSRRDIAIKGEGDDFRRGMIAAYKRMTELMPDNGMQIIMFTHQSGKLWADMANIVWASGLRVTAAWYVVTETDSALRDGAHVKGTVLLVLRKRLGNDEITRDDLAWELKAEVERQIADLTGLNQRVKAKVRDENLFTDADFQMAGYAAALRVLTKYSSIDGKDMATEALRPRTKGQANFVDELIEFAVGIANEALVPHGISKEVWDSLKSAERFYLKLLELEARGSKTLDNYQNFAKAFRLADFRCLMAATTANKARLKDAIELGRAEMTEASEFGNTPTRAVLYALMQLIKDEDADLVLAQLAINAPSYYDSGTRDRLIALADYLADKTIELRPDEAKAARILAQLIRNQRI
jgi:putative DNA methylase